ncbi:ficolin-3 [Culex quinquefasciatus]|uniref:Ficolin-3 n=1 Tax=Culex quinquefasciatus TaxID=7176 RepID=B0X8G7_CULQU|nr:ficolin-3 [Culex quinquefasciatus]|eukprot:XP_001865939.1 ficolin-3 [Culex quinquefasciatus]
MCSLRVLFVSMFLPAGCHCSSFLILFVTYVSNGSAKESDCRFGYELLQKQLDNLQSQFLNLTKPSDHYIESCRDVRPPQSSGLFRIRLTPQDPAPFSVYCEIITAFGGGWTIVQHRYEGFVDFYRGWQDYRDGFGILGGESWLGLEQLHRLTARDSHELLVEVRNSSGSVLYAHYSEFRVGSEEQKYRILKLGSYSGSAGDWLRVHDGKKFTTYDSDNDSDRENCAKNFRGGWWFNHCFNSHLNGEYSNEGKYHGIRWDSTKPAMKFSRMMIRKK